MSNRFAQFAQPAAAQPAANRFAQFSPEPAAEAPGLGARLLTNAAEAFTSNPIQAADRALSRGVGGVLGALGWENNPSSRRAEYHDQQRRDVAADYEAMPSFTEEEGLGNQVAAGAAALLGQLGGAAADPSSWVGAGAGSLLRQFGIGAGANAALDAPSQADDMRLGIQEGFDPLRSAGAAALGGTFSVAPGALRALRDKWGTPRTQQMSDADFESMLREEAKLNPDIARDLRNAGVPLEAVEGAPGAVGALTPEGRPAQVQTLSGRAAEPAPVAPIDPVFAAQASETLARRRQDAEAQGIRPGEAGDSPEGGDLRRGLRDQPRQRRERMAVADGEMDPAAASTAGRRQPEQGPILADAEGNAYRQTPENEAGRAAALKTKADLDAQAQRDFDLAYRSGDYRRARAIREAQWRAEDAELRRQEQEAPTLRTRGPGGDPVGESTIVDPATARPMQQDSRVTGGTGDRPYVEPTVSRDQPELSARLDADADGQNAEFFRKRAEAQAEDARLRDAETLEQEWARRAEKEKARAEANQRARAKTEQASGGRFDEDPGPAGEGGFWRVNDDGILVGAGGNPVRFRDQRTAAQWAAKNGQGGYFDQVSGRTNTTDTMLRARDRYYADRGGSTPRPKNNQTGEYSTGIVSSKDVPGEVGVLPQRAPGRGIGSEPSSPTGRSDGGVPEDGAPLAADDRLPATGSKGFSSLQSSQNVRKRSTGELHSSNTRNQDGRGGESPSGSAYKRTVGRESSLDDIIDSFTQRQKTRSEKPRGLGHDPKEEPRAKEPPPRDEPPRQEAPKGESRQESKGDGDAGDTRSANEKTADTMDAHAAKWDSLAADHQAQAKSANSGDQRAFFEDLARQARDQAKYWRGLAQRWRDMGKKPGGGWQRNTRQRTASSSDTADGGSLEAAPLVNERYPLLDGGIVKSSRDGPIVFGDQKAAARWIVQHGHKNSVDQIFEIVNHPTKPGKFTVFQRGIADASKPDPKDSTSLYSNPIGQMLSMLFDIPGWKRNIDEMSDLAGKINKGRGRPDGQSTLGALTRAVALSSDGEQRAILKKNPSKTYKETLDKLFANSGDGANQGATLDEAMTMRIQSQAKTIQAIADAIETGKFDEPMIIRMVENPSARRGAMGKVADDIDKLMKESASYLKDAGVEIGTVRNYFPRAFDKDIIAKNRAGFISDASKAYRLDGLAKDKASADAMAEALWMNQMFGGGHSPGQPARAGLGDPFHSRVFSSKTDKLLAQYRQDGIGGVLSSYAARAARRAEISRRFGDNWSGWADIEAAIKKDGAGGALEGLRGHAERVAGIHNRNVSHLAQSASSWVRSFTTLQLLSRVVFSSVAEPLAAAAQTGNVLDGYRALGTTIGQLFRGAKGSQAQLRELAEDVGIIMSEGASSMMAARWSGGDPVGKLESTVLSQFFRGIGMEQYTNASRVGAMRTGMVFAGRLAKEYATDPKRSSFFLKDLGVPEADIPDFVKLMNKLGRNMPTADDLAKAGAAGAALRTVMMRSADRVIQRPSTATRPAWASHPLGAVIFQLRAFGYAFGKNMMLRPERIRQATKRGELDKGEAGKAYFALAVGSLLPLFAAHSASSELRSRITNPERNERETTAHKLERGFSYTGVMGGYDPLFQLISGARYDTKLVDVAAGPFIGTVGSMADSIVQAVGNNNPNTNSGERKVMRELWRVLAEPTLQAALTPMPAGQQTTFLMQIANALTRSAGVRSIEAPVVDAVAGPAKDRKPVPVEGGIESAWRSIEKNLFGAAQIEQRSRPGRAKRPERPSRQ